MSLMQYSFWKKKNRKKTPVENLPLSSSEQNRENTADKVHKAESRILEIGQVTPLRISGLAMISGGCVSSYAFASKQFRVCGHNSTEESGLHVSFLFLFFYGSFGSHQIYDSVNCMRVSVSDRHRLDHGVNSANMFPVCFLSL